MKDDDKLSHKSNFTVRQQRKTPIRSYT